MGLDPIGVGVGVEVEPIRGGVGSHWRWGWDGSHGVRVDLVGLGLGWIS